MSEWSIDNTDLEIERQITTAAIVSTDFLRETFHLYSPSYFQSDYCALVCQWCYEHYNTYKEAPKGQIQDIYMHYRASQKRQPETCRLIAEFLRRLSKKFSESDDTAFNHAFVRDKAELYFRERALGLYIDRLQQLKDEGELLKAEAAVGDYKKPSLIASDGVDVLTDKDLIIASLAEPDEPDEDILFQFPGALGHLLGPFCRDDFVAVAGPMGRGKTWALQYFATQALMANLNVAFFSMGDMTIKQMSKRIHKELTALPTKAGNYLFPVWDCVKNQIGSCKRDERVTQGSLVFREGVAQPYEEAPNWKPCTMCEGQPYYVPAVWLEDRTIKEDLTWRRALRRGLALKRMTAGRLFLESWPRKTGSISDVEATVELWMRQHNFIPHVIITDYADIIKDESGQRDYRHQLNAIWEAHDSLAKRLHCLVVSATQTDRATFGGRDVAGDRVSEDIRKLAHVSLMFGLNQTPHEKRFKNMRVKVLKSRHEESDSTRECILLQQLDCGQFHLDSKLR